MLLTEATYTVPLRTDSDGVIRVGSTRVTLDTMLAAYRDGASAEEIMRRYSTLALADVYEVISYYLRHTEEVEEYLAEGQRQAQETRKMVESRMDTRGIRERLLARQAKLKRDPC